MGKFRLFRSRKRRGTGAVADDLYYFLFFIDALEISVIDRVRRQIAQKKYGQHIVEITQGSCGNPLLQHHTLGKTAGRIFFRQSRERLDDIHVKFFFFNDFFHGDIQADRSVCAIVIRGHFLEIWSDQRLLHFLYLFFCHCIRSFQDIHGISGIDIHTKLSHKL